MKLLAVASLRGDAWLGGVNYFRGLVHALRAHPAEDGTTINVLTNRPEALGPPSPGPVEIVDAPWLDPTSRALHFANGAMSNLLQYNPLLYTHARATRANLITHALPGLLSPCPILFWMPDFQHRHLPGYFSAYERWRRDRNVRAAARHGHILFSSNSAAADFRRFYPRDAAITTAHVLPFPPTGGQLQAATKPQVLARHGISDGYFLVPNQFWRHKNHKVVIEALRLLPERFHVVCTGAVADSRGGAHIRDMLRDIDTHGLERRFTILGVLPRDEMLSLLQHARCVINPSLFEGWSTVVEEAKLGGKRLVLSDIPVHREQDPEDGIYFSPTDPAALAAAMERVESEGDASLDQHRAERARTRRGSDVRRFADAYWRIARIAAGGSGQ